jgi:hypothetical protein
MTSVEKPVAVGFALLLVTTASACLDAGDQGDMTIDVFWDRTPGADIFSGTNCAAAGVATHQYG